MSEDEQQTIGQSVNGTEWLCRGCEADVEKMVIHEKMIEATITALGSIPGRPQVTISIKGACERCGNYDRLLEYERTKRVIPDNTVIVDGELKEIDDDSEIVEVTPEAVSEPQEPVADKYDGVDKDRLIELLLAKLKESE